MRFRGFAIRASGGVLVAVGVAVAAPAAAQDGGVRYCQAYDAASNTMFVSQPIAAAAMEGRSAGGFAAVLKERGSAENARARCAEAAGEPQALRARETLVRSCDGCNPGTRLVAVNWPRPARAEPDAPVAAAAAVTAPSAGSSAARGRGDGIAAQPMGGAPALSPGPGPTRVAAATLPQPVKPTSAPHMAPLLIVMGNEDNGRIIAVRDRIDLADEALRRAKAISPTGWKVLMVSRETGSGTAICVSEKGKTRFFVAHPYPTMREATKAAQEAVRPTAARLGETSYLCGAAWTVLGLPAAEPDRPVSDTVVGTIKGKVREMVTCQEPPKTPGTKPTPKRCKDADPRRSGACMCVRG